MVAASVWSLLIPAIEQAANMGKWSFVPAVIGFWLGILFLFALDHIIPHLHRGSAQAEGPNSRLQRTTMLVLAVALHNLPEGMAVGVVYAGYLAGNAQITAMGALVLSIGAMSITAFAAEETMYGIGFVNASSLRLRSEPDANSATLVYAPRNDCVVVISKSGEWYKVNYNLQVGYMHQDYPVSYTHLTLPTKRIV